jgi:hypothetical protein
MRRMREGIHNAWGIVGQRQRTPPRCLLTNMLRCHCEVVPHLEASTRLFPLTALLCPEHVALPLIHAGQHLLM